MTRTFSLLQNVRTEYGAHPSSHSMCTGFFLGLKRLGRDVSHSIPATAVLKNKCSYSSAPPPTRPPPRHICYYGVDRGTLLLRTSKCHLWSRLTHGQLCNVGTWKWLHIHWHFERDTVSILRYFLIVIFHVYRPVVLNIIMRSLNFRHRHLEPPFCAKKKNEFGQPIHHINKICEQHYTDPVLHIQLLPQDNDNVIQEFFNNRLTALNFKLYI